MPKLRQKVKVKQGTHLKSLSYKLIADIIYEFIKKRRERRKRIKTRKHEKKQTPSVIIPNPTLNLPIKQAHEIKKDEEKEQKRLAEKVAKKVAKAIEGPQMKAIEAGEVPQVFIEPEAIEAIEQGEEIEAFTERIKEERDDKFRDYGIPYTDKNGNKVVKVLDKEAAAVLKEREDNFWKAIVGKSNRDDLIPIYKKYEKILPKTINGRTVDRSNTKEELISEMKKYAPVKNKLKMLMSTNFTTGDIKNAIKQGLEESNHGTPQKQKGTGAEEDALSNFDIADKMKDYEKDGFLGVYALDQLKKVPKKSSTWQFSIIANTLP